MSTIPFWRYQTNMVFNRSRRWRVIPRSYGGGWFPLPRFVVSTAFHNFIGIETVYGFVVRSWFGFGRLRRFEFI